MIIKIFYKLIVVSRASNLKGLTPELFTEGALVAVELVTKNIRYVFTISVSSMMITIAIIKTLQNKITLRAAAG